MFRIQYLTLLFFISGFPVSALANCTEFNGYTAEGNWSADIEERLESILMCEQWGEGINISLVNHAEGFIVQGLLSEQKNDEAIEKATQFFTDATHRYEAATHNEGYLDILTAEGKLYSRMSSNLQQTGVLLVDVMSLFNGCEEISALNGLMEFTNNAVGDAVARRLIQAEAARRDMEQRLEEYSLEEWQEYYPEVQSKADLRLVSDIRSILEPSILPSATFQEMDTRFMSLFTTTVRVDAGRAEVCLAEAFHRHPEVIDLGQSDRFANFPRTVRFIEEHISR